MVGNLERYIYSWSITDRLRNYRMKKSLKVNSIIDVTASQNKIPIEKTIEFYERCLDVLFHHKIDESIKSMISRAIYGFYTNSDVDKNELLTIEQYIRNMNAKDCSIPSWKAISTFFMCNGFFYLSFITRQKYKEQLFSTKGRVYQWARAQAYLEDDDIASALKEIAKIERSIGMRNAYTIGIPTAKRFVQIITESKKDIKSNRDMQAGDIHFYNFISGKKVVIEGPAPELEDPDFHGDILYVRNNDFVERNEKKTDITYLNYQAFKTYKSNYKEYHNRWRYTCFKQVDANWELTDNTRISKNPTSIFLMGHPNMLPLMIYDLVGEDIYVTGNNLYITSAFYRKEYEKAAQREKENSNIEFCRNIGDHDAISQYLFLKKLYDANLFDTDKQLAYAMNLGVETYCKMMDEVHGIAHQAR